MIFGFFWSFDVFNNVPYWAYFFICWKHLWNYWFWVKHGCCVFYDFWYVKSDLLNVMFICSIDSEFVWHLWVDNNANSVTDFKVSHLRVISSQPDKDFRNSITLSASYRLIYCGSAGLVLKIPFNILVTNGCLPNSIPSFTGSMSDRMLLAVLIAEYPSPFLYKLNKNLVPSLIVGFEISTVWVLQNVVHCLKYVLYCFLVPDAQEPKISFSTSKFK